MAPRDISTWSDRLPAGRPALDLRVVRWAVLLFLVADSSDTVVGVLAPSAVVSRTTAPDVIQTLVGLVACACFVWQRWRGALPAVAVLLAMLLVRHPVGIEINVLVVGAATLAVVLRPRALALSLAGSVVFAVVLGHAARRDQGDNGLTTTLVALVLVVLATAGGLIARRLLREREEARRVLRRLAEENVQIRTDERRALAEELQAILTGDFTTMRATVADGSRSGLAEDLRRTIARVGEQSRSTLASVRVALHALRAELEPGPARTAHAPGWIDAVHSPRFRRIVLAAGLVAALVALVAGLRGGYADGPGAVAGTVVAVAGALTVSVTSWRLRAGVVTAVVVLLVGLATPEPSAWVAIPAALLCYVAARGGSWLRIAAAVAAQLAYMALQLARHGADAGTLVGVLEAVSFTSVLLGLTVGHFEGVRSRTGAELEQLHTEQGRIAAEERAGVARELHDVVGHQLSLVSLQALAAEREQDPEVLHGLVRRIHRALEAGEAEIGGLVDALHGSGGGRDGGGPAPTPTVVASELFDQLEGHRYQARFTIDPRIDDLDPTTQTTVARILQESGTNVLRHAPTGAECSFAATIDEDDTLTFVARSPLPTSEPRPYLSGGYGLRGIRERVDLTGGTFFAGARGGSWEVQVSMRAQPPGALERAVGVGPATAWAARSRPGSAPRR